MANGNGKLIGVTVAVLALAGCNAGPSGDSALPAQAFSPSQATLSTGGPRDTGTFPNINDEPTPSLDQFTNAEEAELKAELERLREDHDRGRISTAAYRQRLAFLQQLAASHSGNTLRTIQSQ